MKAKRKYTKRAAKWTAKKQPSIKASEAVPPAVEITSTSGDDTGKRWFAYASPAPLHKPFDVNLTALPDGGFNFNFSFKGVR